MKKLNIKNCKLQDEEEMLCLRNSKTKISVGQVVGLKFGWVSNIMSDKEAKIDCGELFFWNLIVINYYCEVMLAMKITNFSVFCIHNKFNFKFSIEITN